MKCIILLFATILVSSSIFAQQKTYTIDKDALLARSQKQKTAAWIFLGAGSAVTAGGTVLFVHGMSSIDESNDVIENELQVIGGAGAMLIGIGAMCTSIPFFVKSHKNYKRAMSFHFKNEMAPMLVNGKLSRQSFTALAVTINLGR